MESTNHLFFECPLTSRVWYDLTMCLKTKMVFPNECIEKISFVWHEFVCRLIITPTLFDWLSVCLLHNIPIGVIFLLDWSDSRSRVLHHIGVSHNVVVVHLYVSCFSISLSSYISLWYLNQDRMLQQNLLMSYLLLASPFVVMETRSMHLLRSVLLNINNTKRFVNNTRKDNSVPHHQSFAQAVPQNNVISTAQLLKLCIKGDEVSISYLIKSSLHVSRLARTIYMA